MNGISVSSLFLSTYDNYELIFALHGTKEAAMCRQEKSKHQRRLTSHAVRQLRS